MCVVKKVFDEGRNIDIENNGYMARSWGEEMLCDSLTIRVKSKVYRVFFNDDEAYYSIDCDTFEDIIPILEEHNAKNYMNIKKGSNHTLF